MGRLLKLWPEPRICYLQGESKLEGWGQGRYRASPDVGAGAVRAWALPVSLGMWGSAFAANLDEIFQTAGFNLDFLDWHRGSVNVTGEGSHLASPCILLSSNRVLAEA